MQIREVYDLTGSYRDAAELAGCSHHTVARYVEAREGELVVAGLDAAAVKVNLLILSGSPACIASLVTRMNEFDQLRQR